MQKPSSSPRKPRNSPGHAPPLSASSLRWDDARVLLALLKAHSLSGAGARLGVNASTVSRRLDALEAALGARLFDRTPDGVLPTSLAEELAPHAEAMERGAAGLALAAQGREVLPEGEVRLTAPPGVAEYVVAPALPRLLARYPRIRMVIDASITVADLTRREADVALRTKRPSAGDLVTLKVAAVGGGIYGAPGYVKELRMLRHLGDARWITRGDDLAHLAATRFVSELVPPEQVALRTSHVGTMTTAAAAGVGVLLLDASTARARGLVPVQVAPGLLRTEPSLEATGELWLVTHRSLRHVPRVAAVWEFLVEEVRRLAIHPDDHGTADARRSAGRAASRSRRDRRPTRHRSASPHARASSNDRR